MEARWSRGARVAQKANFWGKISPQLDLSRVVGSTEPNDMSFSDSLPVVDGNSRFGEFNSRLGRHEFPFRSATGITRMRLIQLTVFEAERPLRGENRKNSRFNGKSRELGKTWRRRPTGWCRLDAKLTV